MTGLVWRLEWRIALARRRLLLLNVVIPLLLVAPIAFAGAPAFHAAAAYTVLFVLHGTFGSAIPLIRDAETGMVGRMARTGLRPAGLLLERAAAGASLDVVQLVPSIVVIGVSTGADVSALLGVLMVLAGGLWVANLVGVFVAAIARSLAEGALFSAVTALLLLHASGVFRTPAEGSMGARVEGLVPFRGLHESLLEVSGVSSASGVTTMWVWAGLLPLVLGLSSRVLIRRFPGAGTRS